MPDHQTSPVGEELKPCPFCGGDCDPEGWLGGDDTRGPECELCGATANSIEWWNRRSRELEPGAVPIPTSADMARLMLGLSYRYLQENAPHQLTSAAPTQPKAQVGSIDTPEFRALVRKLLTAHNQMINGPAGAALIAHIDGWAGSRAGDAVPAKEAHKEM